MLAAVTEPISLTFSRSSTPASRSAASVPKRWARMRAVRSPHPPQRLQLPGGEAVQVRHRLQQAVLQELIDQRRADRLDIHRAARDEVAEAGARPRPGK